MEIRQVSDNVAIYSDGQRLQIIQIMSLLTNRLKEAQDLIAKTKKAKGME